jgi:hypothetical protein
MKTWAQLMDDSIENTPEERCIVQMVCALSVTPLFSSKTPDAIYTEFERRAHEIFTATRD